MTEKKDTNKRLIYKVDKNGVVTVVEKITYNVQK